MTSLQIPELYCPFEAEVHPATERVQRASVERWADALRLSPGSRAYRRLSTAGFGCLMGRCHPRAHEADLRLIVDFVTWLFLWDDVCDEELSTDPSSIHAQNQLAYRIMRGSSPTRDANPLVLGFADVQGRLAERMPPSWVVRFNCNLQDYFEACVWQAQSRAGVELPDVDTYIRLRRLTGAVYPALDLVALAERVQLPVGVRSYPGVETLRRITNDLICWANDIVSLPKDLRDEQTHNLVFVLQAAHGSTLEAALRAAVALHDAAMARFLEEEAKLPDFGALQDCVARYVLGLRSWIRANIDWSMSHSQRYFGADQASSDTEFSCASPPVPCQDHL